ncbi:hypothetical protein C2S53_019093 [Perilla frutescens var. hirtella]|uniref:Bifunctional inhibitor/plant lipid transfer protein/seed storage helical domain-containing protein n=1 Tax=Perilla frutescens var. hirtella TaxID=608512 RepID=A0AAD4JGW9_PERFH|nr:hypothetical protein C2S53_019093 [Perilla frutescens var. hirtella]
MAKFNTALLILVIAVAAASSASARPGSSCEMEMEQKMPMRQCMMWMQGKMRNPRFQEEHLQECCGELMQFSSGCRCDAVKEMMMDVQQYGQREEMERMACSLPRMCGMSQECHSCRRRAFA